MLSPPVPVPFVKSPYIKLNDHMYSLSHEMGNDTVENGILIVQWFALFTNTIFSGAKSFEILHCYRNSFAESE